jgi:hypothetical protein
MRVQILDNLDPKRRRELEPGEVRHVFRDEKGLLYQTHTVRTKHGTEWETDKSGKPVVQRIRIVIPYAVGAIIDLPEKQAASLIEKGLARAVPERLDP